MEHMERIHLDVDFVKEQIDSTKNRYELAKACNCSVEKVVSFIRDNGLYEYYCNARGKKYDPSKENNVCSICGYDKNVRKLKGVYYCKRHYNQIYRYGKSIERTIYTRNDIIIDGTIAKIILRDKDQNIKCETIIDAEDIDKIKNYKWYESFGYCVTKGVNPNTGTDIANIIFNDYENAYDHISHDRLDNRKCNLRPVTQQQNAMNMGMKCTNTSGVTGVSKAKTGRKWNGRWTAQITFNYKCITLGTYKSFNEAVNVRLMAEAALFGEYSPNYNPETNTVQLTYTSQDDGQEYFCEYALNGEMLNDYKKSA